MKIALINGSPRGRKANSERILQQFKRALDPYHSVFGVWLNSYEISETQMELLKLADCWIIAAPLFLDSLPSNLTAALCKINGKINKKIILYSAINCGYYDPLETKAANRILENFCAKNGFVYGGGICLGAGPICAVIKAKNALKMIYPKWDKSFGAMVECIMKKAPFKTAYLSPVITKRFYVFMANISWIFKKQRSRNTFKFMRRKPIKSITS